MRVLPKDWVAAGETPRSSSMKKLLMALLAGAFLFGFGMKVFAADSDRSQTFPGQDSRTVRPGVDVPEAPRYTCPPTPYINCMPPVEKSARRWCDPEYLEWAKGHCPAFKIVY